MAFEDVLSQPAVFLKEQPKAMLPAVLLLVPQVLFLALAAVFLTSNASFFEAGSLQTALQNPAVIVEMLVKVITQLALPVIAIVIISWLAQLLLSLVFVEIALQSTEKKLKQVRLKESFQKGLSQGKLGRLALASIIGYALVFVAIILVVAIAILLVSILGMVFSVAGTIAGVLAAILIGGVGVLLLLAGLVLVGAAFWLLPVIISLESRGAWEALKRSFSLARAKPLHYFTLLVVTAVLGVVFSQVSSLLAAIPLAGYGLSQLVMLPFTAWAMLLPTRFYFEYLKK